jgi:hypothetical protein
MYKWQEINICGLLKFECYSYSVPVLNYSIKLNCSAITRISLVQRPLQSNPVYVFDFGGSKEVFGILPLGTQFEQMLEECRSLRNE